MHAYSLIAQSVERRTVNPQVPGSSPGRGAKLDSLNTCSGYFHIYPPAFMIFLITENTLAIRFTDVSTLLNPISHHKTAF